jgi:hypothetical protein
MFFFLYLSLKHTFAMLYKLRQTGEPLLSDEETLLQEDQR